MNRRTFSVSLLAAAASAQTKEADRARRDTTANSIRALERERDSIGKRDYKLWSDSLAGLRKELRAVMTRESTQGIRTIAGEPPVKMSLFRADRTPPLFCVTTPGEYVAPNESDPLAWNNSLRAPEAILGTSRWLKKKGVDLIFVPVPTVADVYMDGIVPGSVPPDLIAAPHLRKVFLELMQKDVEVLDLLPAFLKARDSVPYPLYFPADGHWSHSGIDICVQALAARLSRYKSFQLARQAPPAFKAVHTKDRLTGSLYRFLATEEKAAIEPFLTPEYDFITRADGSPYGNYPSGPVMLIGDSFSTGVGLPLARALNAPVAMFPTPGGSIDPIKVLLRNPEALAGATAVVWVVHYTILFLYPWTGLPEIIHREASAPSKNR